MTRSATRTRTTKETDIEIILDVDGTGTTDVSTGLPFFDHMLDQLGRHGGFDLTVRATGDLQVDGHHTVEDVAILLGEAFARGARRQAGCAASRPAPFPLDEALVEVALDLSGRPFVHLRDRPSARCCPSATRRSIPRWSSTSSDRSPTAAAITLHLTTRRGTQHPPHRSRPRSRVSPAACATRCESRAAGSRPRRAPCDRARREEPAMRSPCSTTGSATCARRRRRSSTSVPMPASPPTTAEIDAADAVVLPGRRRVRRAAWTPCAPAASTRCALDGDRRRTAVPRDLRRDADALRGIRREPGRRGARRVLPVRFGCLPPGVKPPQMQWNLLDLTDPDHPLFTGLDRPWIYFVHCYAPQTGEEVVATCDYGGDVVDGRGAPATSGPRSSTRRSRVRPAWRCSPTSCAWLQPVSRRSAGSADRPVPGDRPARGSVRAPLPRRLRPRDHLRRRPRRLRPARSPAAGARVDPRRRPRRARSGEPRTAPVSARIAAAVAVPVQSGGGVRDEAAAAALADAGVARVVIGTAALERPDAGRRRSRRAERVAVGLDARGRRAGRATAGRSPRAWISSRSPAASPTSGSRLRGHRDRT